MGSGLILLAIVGAWLAVLVPMALRRHDASNLGTVDKFHDAMRVLSRREGTTRSPERQAIRVEDEFDEELSGRGRAVVGAVRERLADRRDRPRASAAARRRRVLIALLLLAVGSLLGVVLGPLWLLAPHLGLDLLLIAFLVHLRRTATARAEREWRSAMRRPRDERSADGGWELAGDRRAVAARPARSAQLRRSAELTPASRPAARVLRSPVHVAGVPDRMPPRPVPLGAPLPVPAARYDEVPPARGAQGEAWSPVPVPAPTYLSAPAAPRRVVDLTKPGAYADAQAGSSADGLTDAERELGIVDQGPQLDEILERRRAVNDW